MSKLKDLARKLDDWGRTLAELLAPRPTPAPVAVDRSGVRPVSVGRRVLRR